MGDVGVLQEAVLPVVPPRVGALALSVAHRPAGGPAAGGDFYDVIPLDGDRTALVVGDVTGHGPGALGQATLVRFTLRAHLESGAGPREALAIATDSLAPHFEEGFATAAVAIHDPHAGTLTYATAAHEAPIVLGPGAHHPVLVSSTPPLGIGAGGPSARRQTVVPFPEESLACMLTDGALEARVRGELVGRARVEEWMRELGERPAAGDMAELIRSRAAVSDDLAVCFATATAGADTGSWRVEELHRPTPAGGRALPRRMRRRRRAQARRRRGAALLARERRAVRSLRERRGRHRVGRAQREAPRPSPRNLPGVPFARTAPLRDQLASRAPRAPVHRPLLGRHRPARRRTATAPARRSPSARPRPLAHALRAPGQLGLGRAYVSGELEVDDIDQVIELLDDLAAAAGRPRRRRAALAAARAAGLQLPPKPPQAELRPRGKRHTRRARRALGAPPLRRRQRVLRAVPRRHDDLQLRDLRDARPVARGRPDQQARDGLPQAGAAAGRPPAGRRLRLGRRSPSTRPSTTARTSPGSR